MGKLERTSAEGSVPSGAVRTTDEPSPSRCDGGSDLPDLKNVHAAILNAVPAHIALLDQDGVVIEVNQPWQRFADANTMDPGYRVVGTSYLGVCEGATGEGAEGSVEVLEGIRKVLGGEWPEFTFEYPCHSPEVQRWYRLMVTPLREGNFAGAVVTHIDITARRHLEDERHKLVHDLGERVKELRALHRVSELLRQDDLDLPVILTRLVALLPPSLQFVDVAAARIRVGDLEHVTENFQSGPRSLLSAFAVGDLRGEVEVVYLGEGESQGTRDFLSEEHRLVESVAEMLRQWVERQQSVRALSASEERFREMADNIADVFFNYDVLNNRLLYANRVYEQIWGRSMESVLANPLSYLDGVHAEDRAAVEAAFAAELAGEASDLEYRVVRPDGTMRWVRGRAVPILDEAGQVIRIVGTMQDITEGRLAADEVRHNEQRFRLLAKATTDAIWDCNLDTGRLWWNEGFETLFGFHHQQDELTLESLLARVHPQDRELMRAGLMGAVNGGEAGWRGEYRFQLRDGSYASVLDKGHVLRDQNGRPVRLIGGMVDLTERRRYEQQLLRAQRMESIGTLAGGIAHDLNNLLAPITLSVDLLRQLVDSPECLQIIAGIEQSALRGSKLVRQVLSFARGVEGDHLPLHLDGVVEEVRQIMERTFPKDIRVRVGTAVDLWTVKGDATQINQVLLNLCVNARDAMPNGGDLTIAVHNRIIDEQMAGMSPGTRPGRYVVIEVSDTGCGIAKDHLTRIFDPFFTTKEVGRGTGLGLSTAVGIVRSHGGFLNVYSELGKGTTFKLSLPAVAAELLPAMELEVEERYPRGAGECILVVDDEQPILKVCKQTLEAYGYRVLTAEDGAQAVGEYALHRAEIAVVLTDMMMPVMDGPALIGALKRMDPAVRIIGSSGLNANGRVAKAVHAGVAHFVPKPYTAETLLKAVRAVLADPS